MSETFQSEARRYNHILSEIDAVYHEIALNQGLSDSAMSILYVLAEHDGSCLLSKLIKQSGLQKQTINSALRKLEKEDILYLEPADGKTKRVLLTAKGTFTVHNTIDKVIAMENKIYSSWEPEEWKLYLNLTERFLHEIQKEMKEFLK